MFGNILEFLSERHVLLVYFYTLFLLTGQICAANILYLTEL